MPDYGFKAGDEETEATEEAEASWPAVDAGTSLAGFVGGLLTLLIAGIVGLGLKAIKRNKVAELGNIT